MMPIFYKKHTLIPCILISLCIQLSYAGPPFNTDDPLPVEKKHWEFYITSMNIMQPDYWSGTLPHFEINYGLISNVQIHALIPFNYTYSENRNLKFGYSYTEFGIKYCFLQETENTPQIGIFPIIEIPTINNKDFGNGKAQIYLPLWLQKSWGKFTTYGGCGYWINPGTNNKNWLFSGCVVQYDFIKMLSLGSELYFRSASSTDTKSAIAFNAGGSLNLSSRFHVLFSIGHNITNTNYFTTYTGLLWTI
jgi:hypothetical protein